jgi:predicted nucleic acid-binding protein
MTLILDSGAVSALARDHEWLALLRKKSKTPPQVPAAVLAEALTGDHRRDHHANRLLKLCVISAVDEPLARRAARLRTLTQRAGTISATDAIVAAMAATQQDPVVITSDPKDLTALLENAAQAIRIETV